MTTEAAVAETMIDGAREAAVVEAHSITKEEETAKGSPKLRMYMKRGILSEKSNKSPSLQQLQLLLPTLKASMLKNPTLMPSL